MYNQLLEELKQIIIDKKKDIMISIDKEISISFDLKLKTNRCNVTIEPEYWRFEQENVDLWMPMNNIKKVNYIEHPQDEEDECCEYSILYDSDMSVEFLIDLEQEENPKLPFGD